MRIKNYKIRLALLLTLLTVLPQTTGAAPRSNYAEVEWFTAETEHFVIHYHRGVEWTARKVINIAEKAYSLVTGVYGYPLDKKTHVVVRDLEDHANGFAVWHLNWITIWATNSTFQLRGRHHWVYGTFVHEFAHVVSLQRSANFGRMVEGIRLGGLAGKSADANTEVGGSLFLSSNPVPRWWAEGVAQLDAANSDYDDYDSTQEMLLRSAALEDNLLTFDELHNIAVRENFAPEMVYNQGFSFLAWLQKKYGNDIGRRLAENQQRKKHFDFSANFKELFGTSARQLYKQWQDETQKYYQAQVATINQNQVAGARLQLTPQAELDKIKDYKDRAYQDGIWNFYPRYSPDGHFFSYVNNTTTHVRFLYRPFDLKTIEGAGAGTGKTLEPTEVNAPNSYASSVASGSNNGSNVSSSDDLNLDLDFNLEGRSYSWGPKSDQLILARKSTELTGGYNYYDLYHVDLRELAALGSAYIEKINDVNLSATQKTQIKKDFQRRLDRLEPRITRLSHQLRSIQPAFSPDGNQLLFVKNRDGRMEIQLTSLTTNETGELDLTPPHQLIDPGDGGQARDPVWSPDGKQIAYTLFREEDRKGGIWLYDLASQTTSPLLVDGNENRDPQWITDNDLLLSSDRSGIFQIYRFNVASQKLTQLTQVTTGAYYPFMRPDQNELLYSYFSSFGFKLYHLDPRQNSLSTTPYKAAVTAAAGTAEELPIIESRPYTFSLRPPRLFPTLVAEDSQFKAGMSLQLADYLEKHNLVAAALFGKDQDYSLYYLNRSTLFDIAASYTKYVRNSSLLTLINDNDGINDEPKTLSGFDIDFVTLELSHHLYPRQTFNGDHTFSLSYNLRNVDRQLGIPVQLLASDPTSIASSFRLITNHDLTAEWQYRYFADEYNPRNDVNPRDGRFMRLAISHVWSDLFTPDTSFATPTDNYEFNRFIFNYIEYLAIPKTKNHTLEIKFNGGYIDRDVNVNDEFFAGGRLNFRAFGDISDNSNFSGYEAFSINGETLLLLSANYRFPLFTALDRKIGVFYFDSLYASLFSEAGNAWDFGETHNCSQVPAGSAATCSDGNVLLEDVGAELRLKAFLFNDFNPWNSVARVAYGFQDTAEYGFSDDDLPVRFFVGLGTDF